MPQADDIHNMPDRPFSVLCFDWEEAGAAARDDHVAATRSLVERLCALGVDIAVVSQAGIGEVDGRLRARPDLEGHLFLFLSGGSEVYVVGPQGPRLLARRQASKEEEARLATVAAAVGEELTSRGLDVSPEYDGFNRWRIDVAPAEIASDGFVNSSSSRGDACAPWVCPRAGSRSMPGACTSAILIDATACAPSCRH